MDIASVIYFFLATGLKRFSLPKRKCQQTLTFRDTNINLTFCLTFEQLNIYVALLFLLLFIFFEGGKGFLRDAD